MKATLSPLSVPATVAEMYRLADAYTGDVRGLPWVNSLENIFSAVQHIPYIADNLAPECMGLVECVKRPRITLLYGGDCDDKAVLAGAALSVIGVPWRIVTASYDDGPPSHVYLEVGVAGRWLPFDATTDETELFAEKTYSQKQEW